MANEKGTSSGMLWLKDVRMSFPNLFQVGKNGKFSAAFIYKKEHPAYNELVNKIIETAKAKWPTKWEEIVKQLKAANKLCLCDGDGKSDYAGYAGNVYTNASNSSKPTVVDRNRAELTMADGKLYSGCYVNAKVEVWAQDHVEHGKRINASLMGVQFLRDGERLSGGAVAKADDFEAIPEDATEAGAVAKEGAAALF